MLPATALAEGTETANADHPHTADTQHPVCGGGTCTDGGSHQSQTWQGISDLSDIATGGGNYYLTTDVTLSETWTPVNGTVLCLNGYSIAENADMTERSVATITVGNNVTFTLTDCAAKPGKITHADGKIGCGVLVKANGTFTMYGGSITGNTDSTDSGGVFVAGGGKFTMYGGSITGNAGGTNDGGGVYVSSNSSNVKGQFIMNGGTITKNTAQGAYTNGGGGVYVYGGIFTMTGGTIGGTNETDANISKDGGGVYVFRGRFTMTGGNITGNKATRNGGGVVVNDSTFEMSGGVIYNNSTTENNYSGDGGGVYVTAGSQFTMTDGKIIGNKAVNGGKGGGVFVSNYGNDTFQMQGGIIGGTGTGEGNHAYNSGGGVYMDGGSFTMSGTARITGNTTYVSGGGVYVNGGSMNISGEVQITGNVKSGVANNVYLPTGKIITIGIDGLTAGAKIGVTKAISGENSVQIATGATQNVNYTQIFTPDVIGNNYMVTKKNEDGAWNLYLGPHEHSWNYTLSADKKTVTASCGCGASGGSVTISAPVSPTYDGTAKVAEVSSTTDWQGENVNSISYSKKMSGGSSEPLEQAPINAGSYIASVTANGKTASVEYTIAKATPQASDFTFTKPTNLTYDGSAKTASVTANTGINGMGDVTVKYFKNDVETEPKDAGEYTVRINVAEVGENYRATTTDLTDENWKFTIAKAPGSVSAPTAVNGLIYNGETHTLIEAGKSQTGTVKYKLSTDNNYSTALPEAQQAGTYTVYYMVEGYSNYENVAEASVDVTISQKPLTIKVKDKSAYVGSTAPNLSDPKEGTDYTVEGLIGQDVLTKGPALSYDPTPDMSMAGEVAIKASGAENSNYAIEYVDGKLTVLRRSSSGSPTYSVTTPDKTENGSVTISPKNAKQGSTVTITVTPDAGYVLGDLGVTDKGGKDVTLTKKSDTEYTFVMPAGQVEVKASFVKDDVGQSDFADVKSGDYFYDAVRWAVEKGVTNGTDATHFSPDASCTRAQIVTFLWRAAGSPEVKDVSGFMDVAEGSYYAKAVAWAVEQGITNGTDATHFSPDASCTRAQSVTFLYRALGQKPSGRAAFADVLADSYYADAVAWAAEKGITNGTDATHFSPNAVCTRAQIVTFLYRAYQGK